MNELGALSTVVLSGVIVNVCIAGVLCLIKDSQLNLISFLNLFYLFYMAWENIPKLMPSLMKKVSKKY